MSNAQQTQQTKPEASSDTYIIGCKLPHGLKLELFNKDNTVKEAHTLKGNNAARIIGGYGLTDGVPRAFFDEWLRRNAKHPAVLNQSIFMHTDLASAQDAAKERREVRSGLEAIDPIANAKKHSLEVDPDAVKNYERQKAENPVRDRQLQE